MGCCYRYFTNNLSHEGLICRKRRLHTVFYMRVCGGLLSVDLAGFYDLPAPNLLRLLAYLLSTKDCDWDFMAILYLRSHTIPILDPLRHLRIGPGEADICCDVLKFCLRSRDEGVCAILYRACGQALGERFGGHM